MLSNTPPKYAPAAPPPKASSATTAIKPLLLFLPTSGSTCTGRATAATPGAPNGLTSSLSGACVTAAITVAPTGAEVFTATGATDTEATETAASMGAAGTSFGCWIGKAPPITVRFGSGAFGAGAAICGTKAGLSTAAITFAMLSGRKAGSGCNIQLSSGTKPSSTPLKSGTPERLPTASTIDAPIGNTSPLLAAAVTKASEYISDRPSTVPPNAPNCSGDTQLNLPANCPCNKVPAPKAVLFAMPKSISFACSTWPSSKITLSGDRSRCTTPARCALSNPEATRRSITRTSSTGIGPCSMRSDIEVPETNSITMQGRPMVGSTVNT